MLFCNEQKFHVCPHKGHLQCVNEKRSGGGEVDGCEGQYLSVQKKILTNLLSKINLLNEAEKKKRELGENSCYGKLEEHVLMVTKRQRGFVVGIFPVGRRKKKLLNTVSFTKHKFTSRKEEEEEKNHSYEISTFSLFLYAYKRYLAHLLINSIIFTFRKREIKFTLMIKKEKEESGGNSDKNEFLNSITFFSFPLPFGSTRAPRLIDNKK